MRVLGALLVALIVYAAVPALQHLAGPRAEPRATAPPIVPSAPAAATDNGNLVSPISPALESDAAQDEQLAIQSRTDQQLRQIQSVEDQASEAPHR
jgi:hypothetical protein